MFMYIIQIEQNSYIIKPLRNVEILMHYYSLFIIFYLFLFNNALQHKC